jgi:type II secretory pathway predicted ATPase ExeA
MYESFYGLTEKPFTIQPDPDFLFLSGRHSMAYAMLEYGVRNRAGFSVICGDIGCGKTTLLRHLINNLGDELTVGIVYNTHQDMDDLVNWIMLAFDQPYEGKSYLAQFDAFQQFLIKSYVANKRAVLIIDEAQNLSPKALESLRMLSNINADKDQLLQVILVGQPELRDLLRRPDMKQFFQRVSVDYFIPPLKTAEVGKYIHHRLHIAGRDEPLFTSAAIRLICSESQGVPRRINILCDTALVYGYSAGAYKIDLGLVRKVIKDKSEFGILGSQNDPMPD